VWQGELGSLSLDGYRPRPADSADKRLRFLAGRAMELLKGKAPAKDVAAYLADKIEEIAR
jgi:Asp-tRNA(Asn)/Glu-tRNA(Gln) amidotransferase B subunit